MNIYSGNVVSKDVLKSFRNLLQSGDGTSAKKLDEDLDILWASNGGNVDLSKWSKDDFSTGLIPDLITSNANILPASPWRPKILVCFSLRRKNFIDPFLATKFFHMVTVKKILVASWRLQKKVNFGPWLDGGVDR